MSNHIKTQNMNPMVLNTNPNNECSYHQMFVSQRNIMTHHMRHIFTPVNQTNKKLYISHNNLLNVTVQSHPTKYGCYKSNEKCLIVATINPISCSHPVNHGTFFNALIDKFIVCKCREIIIFAHNYFRKTNTNKASLCLKIQLNIFFFKRRLGI